MTERQRFDMQEQRQEIFAEYGYLCAVCIKAVRRYGTAQIAHCIAQTKANIEKYGKEVIHHKLNLRPVCSLACNDYCNIGFSTKEADALAEKIKQEISK